MASKDSAAAEHRSSNVTGRQWRGSVLAGLASYLDAGAVVALAYGIPTFRSDLEVYRVTSAWLVTIGPAAAGCAVGAFMGGRLADRYGRRRIYQYGLLAYCLGALCVAFATGQVMLYVGVPVLGLAVGANLSALLALVGESAPPSARGKLLGVTQIGWYVGFLVALVLTWRLTPYGLWGFRVVVLHLAVVAFAAWLLRRWLAESDRWRAASMSGQRFGELFRGPHLRALAWTGCVYLFSALAVGTAGIVTTYLARAARSGGQSVSDIGLAGGLIIGIAATAVVFMRYVDRDLATRKMVWVCGAVLQIVAYAMILVVPITTPVVVVNVTLFAVGAALAGEAMYKTFTQELFPARLRGTAQGLTLGIARLALGGWVFLLPTLVTVGIDVVVGLLTLFLVVSAAVGFFWMPDTAGKSLEQIEAERAGEPAPVSPSS